VEGELRKVVLITGPTAAGKTEIAMEIYDRIGGESKATLISVDSALVYRGMNIGTAKPHEDALIKYPHALIDIRDPQEAYSAADFVSDADELLDKATKEDRLPILVGGSMLYIKCLRDGISRLPKTDPEVRAYLEQRVEQNGLGEVYKELKAADPEAAINIHPNNRQRVIRAMEVFLVTGKNISTFWLENPAKNLHQRVGYEITSLAIAPKQRRDLDQRIESRFRLMLEEGFLDEVRSLRQMDGLHEGSASMRSVGYRQAWKHLDGLTNKDEFAQEALSATRLLAKKQMTWLRSWENVEFFPLSEGTELTKRALEVG